MHSRMHGPSEQPNTNHCKPPTALFLATKSPGPLTLCFLGNGSIPNCCKLRSSDRSSTQDCKPKRGGPELPIEACTLILSQTRHGAFVC